MRFTFHPDAAEELRAAAIYYEGQKSELGSEFLDDFELACAAVLDAPNRWPEIEPGIRRFRLRRFPYGLIYRIITPNLIEIDAVMQLHRQPGYWQNRLD